MTGELRETGRGIALPGSPLAGLRALIAAQLDSGAVPCACPHPVTASFLYLPARILCCDDCYEAVRGAADQQPPTCTICSALASRTTAWVAGKVLIYARLCADCQTTGNVSFSRN